MATESLSTKAKPNFLHQYVPITAWLPAYQRGWLRADLIAGLAVWAMTIPQALAYAGIAGVPAQYALYTVPLAMIAYAIFGTSRTLSMGPESALAIMSAATVAAIATQGSEEYLTLTIALAFVIGILFIIFGLFRMGWVANFMANPVLKGLLAGIALVVIAGESAKIFGVSGTDGNFFQDVWAIIFQLPQANPATTVVGVTSLVLLSAFKRFTPKLPGAFIVVILAILVSSIFSLYEAGVAIVGEVEAGIFPLGLPDITLQVIIRLVPGALGIVLVGYAQSYGMAKEAAETTGEELDNNQELVAYGLSNVASSFSSGFVTGGSLSRTSLTLGNGGRTQVPALLNAGLVMLTLLFLMPFFENLPSATLATIVIIAISALFVPSYFRRLYTVSQSEFWYSVITLLGVLFFGIMEGVLLGVAVSLLVLIRRVTRPGTAIIGRMPDQESYRNIEFYPEVETVPGLLIYRFDSALIFTNAEFFEKDIRRRIDEQNAATEVTVKRVLLNAETMNDIDTTGTDHLIDLLESLAKDGMDLAIAKVKDPVRNRMRLSGAEEVISADNFYASVSEGVRAYIRENKVGSTDS
jgi:high affinity sulfate transporter 1